MEQKKNKIRNGAEEVQLYIILKYVQRNKKARKFLKIFFKC